MRFLGLLLLLPTLAHGGAWPRAQGETYTLLQALAETGEDAWIAFYAEHGLSDRLTFGIDVGAHVGAMAVPDPEDLANGLGPEGEGRARAFLRMPVTLPYVDPDGPWRFSVEGSLGADIHPADAEHPVPRHALRAGLGFSVGRGLDTRWGGGWLNADLRHDRRLSRSLSDRLIAAPASVVGPDTRTTVAATVGLRPAPGHAVEMGFHMEREDDDTAYALGPAWQRDVGRFGAARVGVAVTDEGRAVLSVGLARTFGGGD